ncbi:hypothetical protein BGX27_002441 [Mortierella sp. AM989]|nr:hypothetical protein BGX27_002441 [Mortierella sp. AM989]
MKRHIEAPYLGYHSYQCVHYSSNIYSNSQLSSPGRASVDNNIDSKTRHKAWCDLKMFQNGWKITSEKFLDYIYEALSPKTVIEDNYHLSILFVRVRITDHNEDDRPSYSTIAFHVKGVWNLYIQRCMDEDMTVNVGRTINAPDTLLQSYRK